MKVKGRRQSENVVDIRDATNPRQQAAAILRNRVGREYVMDKMGEETDRIIDNVHDTFREDQVGMEILLGPRWKD